MSKISTHAHDKTFHALMSHRSFAVGVLKMSLPADIQAKLNWESLKLYRLGGKHVSEDLRQTHQADVVYTGMLDNTLSFFTIHIEHQSRAEPLLPIRLLNYQTGLLLQHAKANNLTELPPLMSVVYYHGKPTPYPYSLDWADCFKDSEFAKHFTLQPRLIDLGQMSDEAIEKQAPEIAGAQLAFKYIFSRDFSPYKAHILQLLQISPREIRRIAIQYLVERANIKYDDLIKDSERYLPQEKEYIMQLYQRQQDTWLRQGEQQGMQEGIKEGMQQGEEKASVRIARNLLTLGQDLRTVAKATGLSIPTLEKLQKEIEALQEESTTS